MDERSFMAAPESQPTARFELVGVTFAAKCLGITDEGLRQRIKRGTGSLKPIGQLSEPHRWLFRKADVIEAVVEQRKNDLP